MSNTDQRPAVGDAVKFEGDRRWWTVKATTEHFAALTRTQDFGRDGLAYTVIDWEKGVRGPCNLIGQGYGNGVYDDAECVAMLAEFENALTEDPAMVAALARGERSWVPSRQELEVSHRNRVRVVIADMKKAVA
jgi:hypothetical protein